jgi:hypothetical protein
MLCVNTARQLAGRQAGRPTGRFVLLLPHDATEKSSTARRLDNPEIIISFYATAARIVIGIVNLYLKTLASKRVTYMIHTGLFVTPENTETAILVLHGDFISFYSFFLFWQLHFICNLY